MQFSHPREKILVCVVLFSSCCIWLQTQINPAQLGYVLCKIEARSQYFPHGFLLKEYLMETFLVGGASTDSFVLGTSTWILCSVAERKQPFLSWAVLSVFNALVANGNTAPDTFTCLSQWDPHLCVCGPRICAFFFITVDLPACVLTWICV